MMTPEEEKEIGSWCENISDAIAIRLMTTDDGRSSLLSEFCDHLVNVAPVVSITREKEDGPEPPAIEIHSRLRYHAVPSGRELAPFLGALRSGSPSAPLPESVRENLDNVGVPAFLKLFIAPPCPHCPLIVQQLIPLTAHEAPIHLAVIDGTLFPEMTEKYGIRSVPTLLLDEQLRWTGTVPLQELSEVLTNRDPVQLGASTLEQMLKDGDASRVEAMMVRAQQIFPAFLDLLAHEKMFVRLGAMVVMEELCRKDPILARQAVDPLWERFDGAGPSIQGDILYIIGETKDRKSIPRMEAIARGPFGDDVQEAARDALTRIGDIEVS